MKQGHTSAVLAGLSLVFFLAVYTFIIPAYPNCDVTLYVRAGQLLLRGQRPYIDFLDINPPLIIYLNAALVALAKNFVLPPLEVFEAFVLCLCILSTLALFHLRRQNPASFKFSDFTILSPLLLSALAAVGTNFGEREHLFAVLFLPYFFARWVSANQSSGSPWAESVLTLLAASVGCLKPHFLLTIALYEGYLWLNFRRRPPVLALLTPPWLYALYFGFMAPEIRHAFWRQLVPLVTDRYWTMSMSWPQLFEKWGWLVGLRAAGFAAFAWLGFRSTETRVKVLMPIALLGTVALFSAVLQKKGWAYHLLPADALVLVGYATVLGLQQKRLSLAALIALFATFAPSLYVAAHGFLETPSSIKMAKAEHNELSALIENRPEGLEYLVLHRSVAIFSPNPLLSFPMLLELGLGQGTRYLFMYPLAFFNNTPERAQLLTSHYPRWDELEERERAFLNEISFDILDRQPGWLIFPTDPMEYSFLPKEFDVLRYLSSVGIFTRFKDCYDLKVANDQVRIFELRKPTAHFGSNGPGCFVAQQP